MQINLLVLNLLVHLYQKQTLKLNVMKTKIIAKTVKPARICQNFNHWAEYIKETVQTLKLKQNDNSK
jgi:hypothetical protein